MPSHFMLDIICWPRSVVLALLALGATSCSQSDPLHPVSGKVLRGASPLPNATVTFHPQAENAASTDWPIGQTGADGTFSLATGGKPGAAPGPYKVTIVCLAAPAAKSGKPKSLSTAVPEMVDQLQGAYTDPAKSKFAVEVKPESNQLEPFVVK